MWIDLDTISFTDTKCLWKEPHAKYLTKYTPSPLSEHECLYEKFEKEYSVKILDEQRREINELLVMKNQQSALYMLNICIKFFFHSASFENPIFGTCEAGRNCDFQP